MQNCKEESSSELFEWAYKALCREKNVKPFPMIRMYLQKNCLRFCADHVNLRDWSPLINGIMQDRSLSKIYVYSRCRCKKIREKMDTEKKLMKLRRCARKDRQQPVLYTNCLLQCFVHSVAVCLKNSLMITNLTLDGIPLAPKYLKILGDGLANNRNLQSLSLARCRIGDAGCYILLESLQCNSSLHVLNLSSCCLTNRSATCLSFYFKKRKADLLQNVWKESSLSRNARATEEGLRVLILDKNHRFNDIGLRQLTRMLKNDFWLKILCLRCCGITQHGGEIVLELLQTNSIVTHIDLKDNEVPADVLQTIRKILKNRRSKGEKISMKKRLLSHKHILMEDMISKDKSSEQISKENRFFRNQAHTQTKMQQDCILQMRRSMHVRKIRRKDDKKCRSDNVTKRSHINWTNVDELKNRLSLMIDHNQNLIKILENSTNFLMNERDRRLSAEEAYHKIQPRLRNLRNKIAMQNSIQLNTRYENQVYANLQNVFNEFKICTNRKILRMDDKNFGEEASENRIKSTVCYHKNQFKNEISQFFQKRPNCPK